MQYWYVNEFSYRKRHNALQEESKVFCEKEFTRTMAVDYVYNLNISELVGTQTKNDTKEVLEQLMAKYKAGTGESNDYK